MTHSTDNTRPAPETATITDTTTGKRTPIRLYNVTDTANLCDEIGSLRAEVAELNQTIRALEDLLAMNEGDTFEGDLYRVSLSRDVQTTTVNWKAIAAKFNPSRQLVQAHTKVSTSERPRFRVSARKQER